MKQNGKNVPMDEGKVLRVHGNTTVIQYGETLEYHTVVTGRPGGDHDGNTGSCRTLTLISTGSIYSNSELRRRRSAQWKRRKYG